MAKLYTCPFEGSTGWKKVYEGKALHIEPSMLFFLHDKVLHRQCWFHPSSWELSWQASCYWHGRFVWLGNKEPRLQSCMSFLQVPFKVCRLEISPSNKSRLCWCWVIWSYRAEVTDMLYTTIVVE